MCRSPTFSTWNEPEFSAVTMRMLLFTVYMRMYAYFGVRSVSIGVDFVLGIKATLKPDLFINHAF